MEGEEDTTYRKLFVVNLSHSTSVNGLRSYFLQFGPVASAFIVFDSNGRSRGFGFVTFVNPQDAAIACDYRFHFIHGSTVSCNLAAFPLETSQPSSSIPGPRMHGLHPSPFPFYPYPLPYTNPTNVEEDTTFRKLYVGSLLYSTSVTGLRDYFQQFGTVAEAYLVKDIHGRSRGFGFVTFVNPQDAATACQNRSHTIDGRRIKCNLAGPRMHFGGAAWYPLPYTYPYWSPNYPMYGAGPMDGVPPVYPDGQPSSSNEPVTSNNPMHGPESIPPVYPYGQASDRNEPANGSPTSDASSSANLPVRQDLP